MCILLLSQLHIYKQMSIIKYYFGFLFCDADKCYSILLNTIIHVLWNIRLILQVTYIKNEFSILYILLAQLVITHEKLETYKKLFNYFVSLYSRHHFLSKYKNYSLSYSRYRYIYTHYAALFHCH